MSDSGPDPALPASVAATGSEEALRARPDPSRRRSSRGQVRRAWYRFRQDRMAMVGLAYLVLLGLAGLFNRTLAPFGAYELGAAEPFAGPSWTNWMGGDYLGRDVFSRMLEGAWVSMKFSILVVTAALTAALPIGLIAGYVGGKVDYLIMRVMDAILSFPGLVLAIAIVSVLGPSLTNAMIAIGIGMIPGFSRLIRGQALAVREEVFMEAARAIGASRTRMIVRHLLPNILSPLIVQAAVVFGLALLIEAGLSFLGLGAQAPEASWGSMLRTSYDFVLAHPWHTLPPGIAITITVLAFNTVGDGLRSALGVAQPVRKYGRLGLTSVARPAEPPAAESAPSTEVILSVEGLSLQFAGPTGPTRVLDDVTFEVRRGETVGLVGESGSGKTVTSLSIMRLLQSPPATVTSGSIRFEGRDLLGLPFEEMSRLRGNELAMIFQDPMAALNPAQRVGFQIAQVPRWHEGASRKDAYARALEALDHVGISKRRADAFPHELSGGMRQRVMIAMALVGRPKLLIADEPTTALDVTIQAQVLELLKELRAEFGMSMIFVTHDLGVVADICDRVSVMYAGQIVESGDLRRVFHHPAHPYTEGLLRAMPHNARPGSELFVIPGQVPNFDQLGTGCRLASRCSYVVDACREAPVDLVASDSAPTDDVHLTRCIRSDELTLSPKLPPAEQMLPSALAADPEVSR